MKRGGCTISPAKDSVLVTQQFGKFNEKRNRHFFYLGRTFVAFDITRQADQQSGGRSDFALSRPDLSLVFPHGFPDGWFD